LIGLGTVAFDMASIFTGSLLPSMTSGDGADRLSAAGFAAGYAGGAIALVAATAIVTAHDALGLSTAGALRVAFVLVGIWWLAFSLPAACVQFGSVHSDSTQAPSGSGQRHASTSVGELIAFARSLGAGGWHPLGTMLLGAVLVLGTVQTAISQFSSVALEEFHLDSPALVRLVLLVQLLAMPGAIAIGWISVRSSRQVALSICLTGWAAVLGLAFLVNSPGHLMALAILLALVLGGVQSVLRTSVAVLAPAGRFGTTFGLMQVGTKLAGFAASLIFGLVYAASGQPRGGLVVLLAQLLAGWWILSRATRER
jgi:UMF1 family MFS transporter